MKCENKECSMFDKNVYQIHHNSISKRWECDECRDYQIDPQSPYVKETVYLTDGLKSSKARVEAFRSRAILPMQRNDGVGDYYVGTRTKSGKIIEKSPDIFR